MDETTRPPQKEDLVKLCEELNRLGARYIVIGGLAMNNHVDTKTVFHYFRG